MLRPSPIVNLDKMTKSGERIITNVSIAENTKIEGISTTAWRLISGHKTLSAELKEIYSSAEDFGEVFEQITTTVGMPLFLAVRGIQHLGTMGKVAISKMTEKDNLDKLKEKGILNAGSEEQLIGRINYLRGEIEKKDARINNDGGTYAVEEAAGFVADGVTIENGENIYMKGVDFNDENDNEMGGRSL